jgi:hypothetical protein
MDRLPADAQPSGRCWRLQDTCEATAAEANLSKLSDIPNGGWRETSNRIRLWSCHMYRNTDRAGDMSR